MIDVRIGTRLQFDSLLLRLLDRRVKALCIDHAQVAHDAQSLHLVVHRWAPALQIAA